MSFIRWLEDSWHLPQYGLTIPPRSIKHGTLDRWLEQLEKLVRIDPSWTQFGDTVTIGDKSDPVDHAVIADAIRALLPWRKGPFNLFGHQVDAEWRSELKWNRLVDHVELNDRDILDVGCGNGYYAFRMLQAGAQSVLGLDSTIPYVLQAALMRYFSLTPNPVLPLRFNGLTLQKEFSVVFSMGVLYHQRNPRRHLADLSKVCEPGGTLVLETLYAKYDLVLGERYARMRNVYLVPSLGTLQSMLIESNFDNVKVVDTSVTDVNEQRKTELMPFDSLVDALSTNDHSLTIEGHPRPHRVVIIATRK